jgi:DNA-directed RNA polymerase specialized sigma24 family protein
MAATLAQALIVAVVGGVAVALAGNLMLDRIRGVPKRVDGRMERVLRRIPDEEDRDRWREELRGVLLEFEGRPLKQLQESRQVIRAAEGLAAIYQPPSTLVASIPAPDRREVPPTSGSATAAGWEAARWKPFEWNQEQLEEALSWLSYRERRILELRYGLGGDAPQSPERVGRVFAVSPERINTIERQAFKKLQSFGEAQKLREFDAPSP